VIEPTPRPHVRLVGDRLEIDGEARLLYGGEVQYFRVRDRGFDAARTHALWAETLDRLRDAGMNLVTTYIPWDYHEREEGRLDFAGARDVRRFLELAAERGLYIGFKPGPLITGEWPRGFGSFGAAPAWWKRKHPEALCLDRDGRAFSFHPLYPWLRGGLDDRQPSFLAPAWLEAVRRWFAAVVEPARPFVGPGRPVVLWQLDNETNLYWSDHYRIDFNPAALAHYRAFLERRHGTVARLNRAYGTRHARFADVHPPRRHARDVRPAAHEDWFEAGVEQILEYQRRLRAMWEELGIREPDVLFTTNDTPQSFPDRGLLLPHGPRKNAAFALALDIYPRCIPGPGPLFDLPAQVDLFAKLYDRWNDLASSGAASGAGDRDRDGAGGRACLAVEVEGGIYGIHVLGEERTVTPVLPEVTEQLVLRLLARSAKLVCVYVLRGGYNADGTRYDFQAALGIDGAPRPRYERLKRIGERLLAGDAGRRLLESDEVEDAVGVAVSSSMHAPRPDLPEDVQETYTREAPAVFAWLAHAGANATAVDLAVATDAELARLRVLFHACPGDLPPAEAAKVERFVEQSGGTLVCLLRPGPFAGRLLPAEEARSARLFGLPLLRRGRAFFLVGGAGGSIEVDLARPQWRPPADAKPVLLAASLLAGAPRAEPGGDCLGYARPAGRGHAVFIGPNVADIYNRRAYYAEPEAGLEARRLLARRLLSRAGVTPALDPHGLRDIAVARRVRAGSLLVFLFRGEGTAGRSGVRLAGLDRLGLEPARRYRVVERLTGLDLGIRTGEDLAARAVMLDLQPYASAVLEVLPVEGPPSERGPNRFS
jgi:hypothetical protein